VDLIENGSEVYVTKDNREEFVRLFLQFDVETQAKSRCEVFWKGFSRFIDPTLLIELFDVEELPTLFCGQQALNYEELKKTARYGNGFTPEHSLIKWFWEIVLEEWDDE